MFGIDEIKELIVRISPNGRMIQEIVINGERVDRGHLNVQKIGFEFEVGENGIDVFCTRTNSQLACPRKRTTANGEAEAAGMNGEQLEQLMEFQKKLNDLG